MEKLISVKKLSLNFNLREPKGNKLTNVYCVVKCGNRQFKFSTRCKVNSWQWNKKQQMPTISPNMSHDRIFGRCFIGIVFLILHFIPMASSRHTGNRASRCRCRCTIPSSYRCWGNGIPSAGAATPYRTFGIALERLSCLPRNASSATCHYE